MVKDLLNPNIEIKRNPKNVSTEMDSFKTYHYNSLFYIGSGGLGDVYRAISLNSGSKVAVRKVDISKLSKDTWIELSASCKPYINLVHPNLVRYYDVAIEQPFQQFLLEMELCSGGSLQDVIKKMRSEGVAFDEESIWDIASQIAAGLSWLHSPFNGVGVIPHCNIKPSNILVGNQGVFKLTDFGLQHVPFSRTIPTNQSGAALYRAPELRDGSNRASAQSDIWSFGLLLWTMCTLRHPLFNLDEVTEEPSIYLPSYSQALNNLIEGCLRINPNDRFTITEVVSRVRANAPDSRSRASSSARSNSRNTFQRRISGNLQSEITSEMVSNATYLMSSRPRSATIANKSRAFTDDPADQSNSTPTIGQEKKLTSVRPMSGRASTFSRDKTDSSLLQQVERTVPPKQEQNIPVVTATASTALKIMSRSQALRGNNDRHGMQTLTPSTADTGEAYALTRSRTAYESLRPQGTQSIAKEQEQEQERDRDRNPQMGPSRFTTTIHSTTPSPSYPASDSTDPDTYHRGKNPNISEIPAPPSALNESHAGREDMRHALTEQDAPLSPIVDSLLMERQNSRPVSRADSRSVKRVPKHISNMESSVVHQLPTTEPLPTPQVSNAPNDELSRAIRSNDCNYFSIVLQKLHGDTLSQELLESCFKQAISFSAYSVLPVLADHLLAARMKIKANFGLESRQGVDVDFPSELMIAAQKGDIGSTRANLRDIGQIYKNRTALMLAAEHGSVECIKLLLGELAIQNSMGETALVLAAKKGYVDCISLLHAEGNLTYSEYDRFSDGALISGLTPLMASIRNGQRHCIHEFQYLLKRQASNGTTSLMYAVMGELDACIPYLVDECRIVDNLGESALMKAVDGPSMQVVEFLSKYEGGIQDAEGRTALLRAVQNKNVMYVKAMLRIQKQSSERDIGLAANDGATLFTAAIKSGSEDLIYLLNAEDMTVSKNLRSGARSANAQNIQQTGSVIKIENPDEESSKKCSVQYMPQQSQSQPQLQHQPPSPQQQRQQSPQQYQPQPQPLSQPQPRQQQYVPQPPAQHQPPQQVVQHNASPQQHQTLAERLQAVNSSLATAQPSITKELLDKHQQDTLFVLLSGDVPLDEIDFGCLRFLAGKTDRDGHTALMVASINGNQEFVEKILNMPSMHDELGRVDREGRSALMLSILYQRVACAKLLVTSPEELNCSMPDGTTPLILAIQKRFYSIVPSLLEVSGQRIKEGKSALMIAMDLNAPLHALGSLPEREATLCNSAGDNGLFYAIKNNKHLYLARLAEVANNRQNDAGLYAINIAVEQDCWQCFKTMYDYEVRAVTGTREAIGVPFKTLMLSILRNNSIRILENISVLLRRKPVRIQLPPAQASVLDSPSSIILAARAGNEAELCKLVCGQRSGSKTSTHIVQVYHGRTALMEAAARGYASCVRLLLGEVGFRDENGRTALMLASQNGHLECVQMLLIEAGVKTITRETALTLAVANDMAECADVLLCREYWLSGTSSVLPFTLSAQHSKTCTEIVSIKRVVDLYKMYYKDQESKIGRCHICLDELCTVRCLPCSHDVACPSCVRDILESIRAGNTKRNRCPICRAEIENWTQIFIESSL